MYLSVFLKKRAFLCILISYLLSDGIIQQKSELLQRKLDAKLNLDVNCCNSNILSKTRRYLLEVKLRVVRQGSSASFF